LPTNKIIQFLHHCLPSIMLTISLVAYVSIQAYRLVEFTAPLLVYHFGEEAAM